MQADMSPTQHTVTCPHCHAAFDLSHGLDAINLQVESDFANPDFIIESWRFFFRGYLPAYDNTNLVGCALAWNDSIALKVKHYYGCLPGGEPFQYQKGESFPRPYGFFSFLDYEKDGVEPFVAGKKNALETLRKYVAEQEKLGFPQHREPLPFRKEA